MQALRRVRHKPRTCAAKDSSYTGEMTHSFYYRACEVGLVPPSPLGAVDHSIKDGKEAKPTPTPNPGDNTRFKLEKADDSAGGGGFVHDGWLPMWAQVALLVVVIALLGAVCGCAGYWLRGRQDQAKNYDDDRASDAQVLPAPQRV